MDTKKKQTPRQILNCLGDLVEKNVVGNQDKKMKKNGKEREKYADANRCSVCPLGYNGEGNKWEIKKIKL